MNKYLEKIAAEVAKAESKDAHDARPLQVYTGVVGGGLGLNYAKKQYDRGNLTGRETLYHGSSAAGIAKIKDLGIRPDIGGGVSSDMGLNEMNRGMVFAERRKANGKFYGVQQSAMDAAETPWDRQSLHSPVGKQKNLMAARNPFSHNDKVVKINMPTWRPGLSSGTNPEYTAAMVPERLEEVSAWAGKPQSTMKKILKRELVDNVHVHTSPEGISTDYIKGSKTYKGNSLGEIREYIKANPKRFAGGVGKGVAGLGLAAAGAGLVAHAFRKKDGE